MRKDSSAGLTGRYVSGRRRAAMLSILWMFALHVVASKVAFAESVPLGGTGGVAGVLVTVPGKGTNNNNQVSVKVNTGGPPMSSVTITVPEADSVTSKPGNATPVTTTDGSTQFIVPMGPQGQTITFKATVKSDGSNLQGQAITVTVNYKNGTSKPTIPTVEKSTASLGPLPGFPAITTTGSAVAFNAATGTLTFSADDSVTNTGFAGDSLLGASVLTPTYALLGLSSDGSSYVFQDEAADSGDIQMQTASGVVFEAAAPFLFYDIANNDFSTELNMLGLAGAVAGTAFNDGTLANLSSAVLSALNAELNPGGVSFLGDIPLAVSFTPGTNFSTLTDGFTVSGSAGYVGSVFVTTPEPASVWMFASGIAALTGLRRWRAAACVRAAGALRAAIRERGHKCATRG